MDVDILIIGAGPAGATASLFLSKKGIAHTLVDAATFPRDKVCGDGLDLKVARVLRHLNVDFLEEMAKDEVRFLPITGLRFTSPNGKASVMEYTPKSGELSKPLFYTAKRVVFDDFLIKRIHSPYVDFRQDFKVTKLTFLNKTEGWAVEALEKGIARSFKAKLIVGADGDHSVVLRTLKEREVNKLHYAATVRQYWQNIDWHTDSNLIEVYSPPKLPMSYFYMFPLPNNEVNVGYGMVSDEVSARKLNVRKTLQDIIENDPVIAPRFKNATPLEKPIGWGIPLASLKRKAFGDNYLLVGDAASLVCPTSGEGIGTGMVSGLIAAEFIAKAQHLKQYDQSVFVNYDREIYRRLKGEISIYRTVMALKPWKIYDWGLNVSCHNPLMRRYFEKNAPGWVETAYLKDFVVHV